jgi:S-DNA-T family DNA segregation ATPase FtsK/SpoIIIE
VDVDLDDLLLAAELAVTSQRATAAMIQRKLRVGWDDANALLDDLAEAGVISGGGPGDRTVLVAPDGLADLLARLADTSPPELADAGEVAGEPALVSLVEPGAGGDEPGADLALRPDDELAWRETGELELYEPPARQVQVLVTRVRQATARGLVAVVYDPAVTRTWAVTSQTPWVIARLVKWSPRGIRRVVVRTQEWLVDAETQRLLAKHAEAGEGESYAKVSDSRAKKNLSGRRWLAGVMVGLALVIALAWWAPHAFAGIFAALAFLAVLAAGRSVAREPKELGYVAVAAGALAWLAWWQGPELATLIPQPPGWAWWVLAGVGVVVFGWLGRNEDTPLVDLPHFEMHDTNTPDRPTADMVIDALCRIGVTGMTLAATDRVRDEIRVRAPGIGRSNRGYTIELELPPGVTAAAVMENREELAGALRRKLGCVWPSRGRDHPGHLRLFLSDVPMATAPQPKWPLADGNPIDVFDPIPLVTDQEGEWVSIDVTSTHTVIAGASGFGKSVTLRHLAVALAFDPRARLYVFDGKISGDLDPVRKIAHAYYEGAEEEDVAEQLNALRMLEKEMRRRARFLRDLPPEERSPKVTSALASKYPHLAPIFVKFDECQEYTEYGTKGVKDEMQIRTEFRTVITRLSRLGRSAAIFLILASQKPDADVLPTAVMGNCSNRLCFKVTEQGHNDQVLGTGAYKAGLKATLFSTDDKGLAWLKAAGDPQVVRGWSEMVDLQPAYDLAEIAYRHRKAKGLLTGQAADDGIQDAEVVYDVIQDAEQVMSSRGSGKAQWGDLVMWLQEFRPGQYGALSAEELSASVRAAGIRVRDVRSGDLVRKGVYIGDLRKHCADDDE